MTAVEISPTAVDARATAELQSAPSRRRRRNAWTRLSLSGRIAAAVVLGFVLMAVFAPLLAPYDPLGGSTSERLRPLFSEGHLLGTDGLGRDILSRVIYGARPSLLTGFIPVAVASLIGSAIGIFAGLAGRRVNALTMRVLDVFYAFPAILLAIAVATVLGSGSSNAVIALTIILIPPIARVAEGETARLRSLDFMEAAEVSGARRVAIARFHVLRNVAPPILVYATALIGLAIVYAAGLSFLGLGVQPPTAEWGMMVSDLRQYIFTVPALALVPAITIGIASIAFNVLGDALRDVFDVRLETQA
jgi:peptide/nickel transport system permease protein